MNRRLALLAVLTSLASIVFSTDVWAQKKGGGGNKGGKAGGGGGGKNGSDKKEKASEVHFSGKIKQMTAQGLVIDSDDSKHYVIGLGPTSEVIVEGKASIDFLTPGTAVEFEVELNREGKYDKEVGAITIVELSSLNPAGLFPTSIPGTDDKQDTVTTKTFLARGRVAFFKEETLALHLGAKSISVKVAKNVSLDARINNLRLASVGDSVKGSGELPPQANLGIMRVIAKRLNIKTASTIEPKGANRTNEKS